MDAISEKLKNKTKSIGRRFLYRGKIKGIFETTFILLEEIMVKQVGRILWSPTFSVSETTYYLWYRMLYLDLPIMLMIQVDHISFILIYLTINLVFVRVSMYVMKKCSYLSIYVFIFLWDMILNFIYMCNIKILLSIIGKLWLLIEYAWFLTIWRWSMKNLDTDLRFSPFYSLRTSFFSTFYQPHSYMYESLVYNIQ